MRNCAITTQMNSPLVKIRTATSGHLGKNPKLGNFSETPTDDSVHMLNTWRQNLALLLWNTCSVLDFVLTIYASKIAFFIKKKGREQWGPWWISQIAWLEYLWVRKPWNKVSSVLIFFFLQSFSLLVSFQAVWWGKLVLWSFEINARTYTSLSSEGKRQWLHTRGVPTTCLGMIFLPLL